MRVVEALTRLGVQTLSLAMNRILKAIIMRNSILTLVSTKDDHFVEKPLNKYHNIVDILPHVGDEISSAKLEARMAELKERANKV